MSNYITDIELAQAQQKPISAGYVAFNGHVFTQADCDAYNCYAYDLNKERHKPTRDFLLDQQHKTFCLIIGFPKLYDFYITYQVRHFESDIWYDKACVYRDCDAQHVLDRFKIVADDKCYLVYKVISVVKMECTK